jgi:hypothetical protein
MGRNKKRVPFEPDAGLKESIELALEARQKEEPKLTRNELICRFVRQGLSEEAQAPVVRFACVDALTMAEFRGDVEKMERFFVRVRNAVLNRNRWVDRDDPESVARFQEDDRQTREFLAECKKLLGVAAERAWQLRGFPAQDVEYVSQTGLSVLRKALAEWQAEMQKIESEGQQGPLSEEKATRLDRVRNNVRIYMVLIKVAEFVVLEKADAR